MSDDLIDRLQNPNFTDLQWPRDMFNEAAARIEALEAALRKTHTVLFMAQQYRGYEGGPLSEPSAELAEREARAALEGEKER